MLRGKGENIIKVKIKSDHGGDWSNLQLAITSL